MNLRNKFLPQWMDVEENFNIRKASPVQWKIDSETEK